MDSYLQEEVVREQRRRRLLQNVQREILVKILGFLLIAAAAFHFVFGVTMVSTGDMYPAIRPGDVILFFRPGGLAGNDVVLYEAADEVHLGRVQATAGMQVDRSEGGLLLIGGNQQPIQKRAGLYDETYADETDAIPYPSAVPQGQYLLLADSRKTGQDSRHLGYIPRDRIKGKVFTIMRRRPL